MIFQRSPSGQMLLPMIAVTFLFGLSLVVYVAWVRRVYWKLRMTLAAEAVALSAARQEASLLNEIGTAQWLENALIQKLNLFGENIAHIQISERDKFRALNRLITTAVAGYRASSYDTARFVAQHNGADSIPLCLPPPNPHLVPQTVRIGYFLKFVLVGVEVNRRAFYARDWWPNETHPQPPHRYTWRVCRGAVCEEAKVRLWLDVDPRTWYGNGGFPSTQPSFLQGLGIQCAYPQFNAQLMSNTGIRE